MSVDPVCFLSLLDNILADYMTGLPGYCTSHVLQNPTIWLGIFVGGYVNKAFRFCILFSDRNSVF
jgi:hypothetical protein